MKTKAKTTVRSLYLIILFLVPALPIDPVHAAEETAPRAPALLDPEDPLLEYRKPAPPPEAPPSTPAPANQAGSTPPKPEDEGTIRVPYIPESVKQQLKKEIEADLRKQLTEDVVREARKERWGVPDAWPEWVRRLTFSGDVRLRYQADRFAEDNSKISYFDPGETNDNRAYTLLNTTEDRNRLRLRARLGVQANIDESWDAGIRLATGSSGDPVSTNQTLGSYRGPYSILLDRAFMRYRSRENAWTFWGGRMPNPWLSTDLVWDEDLAFDGLAVSFTPWRSLSESSPDFDPFLTLGVFPLQEVELSSKDKWLYGAQLGFNWRLGGSNKLAFGIAYYDYRNIEGRLNQAGSNEFDFTAPAFLQKGNNLFNIADPFSGDVLLGLASDYNELNITASLANYSFAPTHLILTLDYVKNLGFDKDKITQRAGDPLLLDPFGLDENVTGYQVKFTVGRPIVERAGEWQTSLAYKRLGGNAVLDAFTDSDFHLGGTDAKGWIFTGSYGLGRDVWLTFRYITSDEIERTHGPFGVDTLQFDLNAKF